MLLKKHEEENSKLYENRKYQSKELTIIKMKQPIILIDFWKSFDMNIDIVSF